MQCSQMIKSLQP